MQTPAEEILGTCTKPHPQTLNITSTRATHMYAHTLSQHLPLAAVTLSTRPSFPCGHACPFSLNHPKPMFTPVNPFHTCHLS